MLYEAGWRICPKTDERVMAYMEWDINPNHRTLYVNCHKCRKMCGYSLDPTKLYPIGDKRNA